MPLASQQLREACKSFPAATAVGIDGFRPRHLLNLPDAAFRAFSIVYSLAEGCGVSPVHAANTVFLPKPTGGHSAHPLPHLVSGTSPCSARMGDSPQSQILLGGA